MIATRASSHGGSPAAPARQKHVPGISRRHSTCGVFSSDDDEHEQNGSPGEPGPHPAGSDGKRSKKRQSLDLISQIMTDDDVHDKAVSSQRDARREGGGGKRDRESRRSAPHLAEHAEARSRDQQRAFASVARTRGSGELDGSSRSERHGSHGHHNKSNRSSRHSMDRGRSNSVAQLDAQGSAHPTSKSRERRPSALVDSIYFRDNSGRGRRAHQDDTLRRKNSVSDRDEEDFTHARKQESHRSVASFDDPDPNDHGNNVAQEEQEDTLDSLPMRSANNGRRPRPMSANTSVQSCATIDPEDEIDEYPQTASELRSLIKKMQGEFHKLRSAKIAAEANADKLETELTQCRQELDGELLRSAGEAERWRAEAERDRARADGLESKVDGLEASLDRNRQRLAKSENKSKNLELMIDDMERDNRHLRRAGRHLGNAALGGSGMSQHQQQHQQQQRGGHSSPAQHSMSRSFHPSSSDSTSRSRRSGKGGITNSPERVQSKKKMPSSWHGTKASSSEVGRMADLASRISTQLPLPGYRGDGAPRESFSRSMAHLQRKDTFSPTSSSDRPDPNSSSNRRRMHGGNTKPSRERFNASEPKLWSRRASSGHVAPVVDASFDEEGPASHQGGTGSSVVIEMLNDLNVSSPSLRSSGARSIGINDLEKDQILDGLDDDSTGESDRTRSFDELDDSGTHDC